MLTGRQVFEAENVMQMIARHLQSAPVPPSRFSEEPIPAQCLAKHPTDRPASAWELADRLAECELAEPWTREDGRRWWRSRLGPEPAALLDP
jgi:hypothetical protein